MTSRIAMIKNLGKIFFLLAAGLFLSCSLDMPVAPPDDLPAASSLVRQGARISVEGLKYFEESQHVSYPFEYHVIDSLSVDLQQMNLSYSKNDLINSAKILPQSCFAKALNSRMELEASQILAVPLSAFLSRGDSVSCDSVDSFNVVIRNLSTARKVSPVAAGVDSFFYKGGKLHHIHSRLELTSNDTLKETETDADGDGFLETSSAHRITYIERTFKRGDSTFAARIKSDYDILGNALAAWLDYREWTLYKQDTVRVRQVKKLDNTAMTLQKGDQIQDKIRLFGQDTIENIVTRQLAAAGNINSSAADKYLVFQTKQITAAETISTVWADADSDDYLWDPSQSDTALVWVTAKHRYSAGPVLVRTESTEVAMLDISLAASQRILWQMMVDSLRDKSVRLRVLTLSPNNTAFWNGDTTYVAEATRYNTNSTASIPYGPISQSMLNYTIIAPTSNAPLRVKDVSIKYGLSSASVIEEVLYELWPTVPFVADSGRCNAGRLRKTLTYRNDGINHASKVYENFAFDFRDPAVADTFWCTWNKTMLTTSGDSLAQIVRVNAAGDGRYTEVRSDSLRESMQFHIGSGSFADTLYATYTGSSDSMIKVVWGNINPQKNTGSWKSWRDGVTKILEYGNGRLKVQNESDPADSLTLIESADTSYFEKTMDDYRYRFTYLKLADGEISVGLSAKAVSDGSLKIQGRNILLLQSGIGFGLIREANSGKSISDNNNASDYIDYNLKINLRKQSTLSGDTPF